MNTTATVKDRTSTGSVDAAEIARFDAMASDWWNPTGIFRPLHRLNPARLDFIRDAVVAHARRDAAAITPFAGLDVLDIGCGGGLITEPMRRLGATVLGIDMAEAAIDVARRHAAQSELDIDYRRCAAEDLAASGETFDVVLALEVIEHVADRGSFFSACAKLLKPGGALVASTLNRTPQAFLLAIVGAEYLLGWLPRGTHDWQKFVRPSELAREARQVGLEVTSLKGLGYRPLTDSWSLGEDLGVNYLAFAVKA